MNDLTWVPEGNVPDGESRRRPLDVDRATPEQSPLARSAPGETNPLSVQGTATHGPSVISALMCPSFARRAIAIRHRPSPQTRIRRCYLSWQRLQPAVPVKSSTCAPESGRNAVSRTQPRVNSTAGGEVGAGGGAVRVVVGAVGKTVATPSLHAVAPYPS